jgi:TM2 domain-containing membrane protein YozV
MKQAKCPNCGANIIINEINNSGICEYCNTTFFSEKNADSTTIINNYYANNQNRNQYNQNYSSRNKGICLILCLLGFVWLGGMHDFYLGKIGSGIFKVITLNWFYIGTIIDFFSLLSGNYKDSLGHPVTKLDINI